MICNLISTNTILYCREWEKTIRFYRERLELPVNFECDWFVEFSLSADSRLSIANEKRSSIKSCSGRGLTITLEVEDIEGTWEHVQQNGLEPTRIKKHPWGAQVFYLFDPEGHRIEIWQALINETTEYAEHTE